MINYRVEYTATDDLISQAINIDRQVYSKSDVGKINACKQWLNVNNEIYTFLLDGNKLVGYINFVHLTDECFELFLQGKMKDYRLSIEDILPFEHGNNRCLFMSMAILQEYRDTDAINMLRQAFDKKN